MSTLKATYLQQASSASPNITLDASTNATVAGTLAMGSSFKRNRIINGDMRVFQRGTAATTNASYSVDRWVFFKSNDATESVSQNSDAPSEFSYSLRNTISVADTSIGASQFSGINQLIEGFNIADLAWGTSSAKTITVSFWIKATQTGTYSCAIQNNAATRFCWKQYTISASNTWEYKTLTFTGPNASVGGVWETTTSTGLSLAFYAALGSTYLGGSDGVWSNSALLGPSGMTNGIGTNGNIFAFTGVQLEVGSVATPYERQIYSEQLAQCQRYYFKTFADGTAPAQNAGTTGSYILPQMVGASTTQNGVTMAMPVAMRAMATVTLYNPSAANAQIRNTSVNADCSSSAVTAIGGGGYFWGVSPNCVTAAGSAAGNQMRIHFTVDGEL